MAALSISVEPPSSLIDEQIKILLSGAEPTQKVTLQARLIGDKGEVFESHAHYIADEEGKVDVCVQCCLGGSYTGIESMGLLWSMKAAPGQRRGLRLMKTDVTKPFNITLNCFDGHLTSDLLLHKASLHQPLSSVTFHKWYMADGVQRIPVREGRIRGTLFLPTGDGPFPGVIDLLGGAGGCVEFKASLLASRGFAALALAYFAYDDLPTNLPVVDLDYFEEAAQWLSHHPKVLPHGVGVHAICFGSWIALLLASLGINVIKTVVAISPISIAFFMPFMYKGKLSEVVPFDPNNKLVTEDGSIWRYRIPTISEDNGSDHTFSAITPAENISCPVLLLVGSDDLSANSDYCSKQISECMKKHGREGLCSILHYFNAGHLIEPPYTPLSYSSFNRGSSHLPGESYIVWGGETKAHAHAQEDAWQKILNFLQRNIPYTKCNL